jgi:predicted naringenin-chalcone synthase
MVHVSPSQVTRRSCRTAAPPVEIAGLGTAQPPFVFPQAQALALGLALLKMTDRTRDLFTRVMSADGIEERHIAVEQVTDLLDTDHERKLARFERWGVALSTEALQKALASAGVPPHELDFLAVTTCTGYLCPGLSAYVGETCGLRLDIRRVDLVGMGCGAALPALEQASQFLAAYPDGTAAVVSTEICSAAMLIGEAPDLVVSNAIFADGSAAAVLRTSPPESDGEVTAPACRARLVAFRSLLAPEWRDCLRFRTEGGHLRNVLTKEVPARAAEACSTLVHQLIEEHGLGMRDIDHWVVHAGGKAVLDAVQQALGLPPEALDSARRVLRSSGNMSSPTVLFVLQEEQQLRPPRHGERAIVTSFGAGFAAHAALVEY